MLNALRQAVADFLLSLAKAIRPQGGGGPGEPQE